jgi:putative membrane protein
MLSLFVQWLLYAVSFMLAAKIVPGLAVRSFGSAVLFAVVFSIVDGLLFKLLAIVSLPLVFLSLGLFLLVIRAWLFMLTDKFVEGVEIASFWAALGGSVMTGVLNWLITRFVHVG